MMSFHAARLAVLLIAVVTGACKVEDSPRQAPPPAPPPMRAAASSVVVAEGGSPLAPPPCRPPECRELAHVSEVVDILYGHSPRVVGVGELHAQSGATSVSSTTELFRRDLLPLFAARASSLVLEVWVEPKGCSAAAKRADQQLRTVTKTQAPTNKSEYQKVAEAAQSLGLQAVALTPSCADVAKAADAGTSAEGILSLLEVTTRMLESELLRLEAVPRSKGVVAFGGAMHNDVVPDHLCGAPCSYGAQVSKAVRGKYVALDLIVPETIGDEPFFRQRRWSKFLSKGQVVPKPRLLALEPDSYVLIFATQ